jgi:hypothetical protein
MSYPEISLVDIGDQRAKWIGENLCAGRGVVFENLSTHSVGG